MADFVMTRELTPELLPDWLEFFDGDAFADNPDWGGCYCRCFRFSGGFDAWDAACASGANRQVMSELISQGSVSGALAYVDGRAVGWCQFGSRDEFRLAKRPRDDETPSVGSIVCFVVAAAHRRRGVARALLHAACEGLAHRGFAIAEAYPDRDEVEHRFMSGPLAMYLAAGFEPFRDMERSVVVRKRLTAR